MKRLMAWGLIGPIALFFLCYSIRRFLPPKNHNQSHMDKSVTKAEWDNTPKSVKELVEKLVGTLEVVIPK